MKSICITLGIHSPRFFALGALWELFQWRRRGKSLRTPRRTWTRRNRPLGQIQRPSMQKKMMLTRAAMCCNKECFHEGQWFRIRGPRSRIRGPRSGSEGPDQDLRPWITVLCVSCKNRINLVEFKWGLTHSWLMSARQFRLLMSFPIKKPWFSLMLVLSMVTINFKADYSVVQWYIQ